MTWNSMEITNVLFQTRGSRRELFKFVAVFQKSRVSHIRQKRKWDSVLSIVFRRIACLEAKYAAIWIDHRNRKDGSAKNVKNKTFEIRWQQPTAWNRLIAAGAQRETQSEDPFGARVPLGGIVE